MKPLKAIVIAAVATLFTGAALGETVIREVPLNWQDVATLDGEVVFNNLCAVCHGAGGKGDGPAVSALEVAVPDLTVLTARNNGLYPSKHVENVIYGRTRIDTHGKSPMPYWGEHFMYLRTGVSGIPRRHYMWERIRTLSAYIESLQVK